MSSVRVEIDGHAYRMACGEGEEARLAELAAELDRAIAALKARLGEIGDRRLMVMTALTLLDRLHAAEDRVAELAARADRLERSREAAVLAAEADDEPLVARLEALAAAIDTVTTELRRGVRRVNDDAVVAVGVAPAPPPEPPQPQAPPPPEPEPPQPVRPQVGRSYGSLSRRAASATFAGRAQGVTDDAPEPTPGDGDTSLDDVVPSFLPRR